jgi:uncharacterized protein DUF4826
MTDKQPIDIEFTDEQRQQWVREQYQIATKYLADKGLVTSSVMVEDSRYIEPLISVWKLKLLDGKWFWVICGDVPSDHVNLDVAKNAQEVLRHFSMKWQLQAENILADSAADEEQQNFAKLLIGRAEGLYQLSNNEKLW